VRVSLRSLSIMARDAPRHQDRRRCDCESIVLTEGSRDSNNEALAFERGRQVHFISWGRLIEVHIGDLVTGLDHLDGGGMKGAELSGGAKERVRDRTR